MNGRKRQAAESAGLTGLGIDPKWLWHYGRLNGLRDRLLRERNHQLAQAAEPIQSFSLSIADAATDEFDQEMALGELSLEQELLFEVEEALRRIQNHTYGRCEITGKPIAQQRLRAVPWTRFTKAAAEQLEREGAIQRAQLGRLGSVRQD